MRFECVEGIVEAGGGVETALLLAGTEVIRCPKERFCRCLCCACCPPAEATEQISHDSTYVFLENSLKSAESTNSSKLEVLELLGD